MPAHPPYAALTHPVLLISHIAACLISMTLSTCTTPCTDCRCRGQLELPAAQAALWPHTLALHWIDCLYCLPGLLLFLYGVEGLEPRVRHGKLAPGEQQGGAGAGRAWLPASVKVGGWRGGYRAELREQQQPMSAAADPGLSSTGGDLAGQNKWWAESGGGEMRRPSSNQANTCKAIADNAMAAPTTGRGGRARECARDAACREQGGKELLLLQRSPLWGISRLGRPGRCRGGGSCWGKKGEEEISKECRGEGDCHRKEPGAAGGGAGRECRWLGWHKNL